MRGGSSDLLAEALATLSAFITSLGGEVGQLLGLGRSLDLDAALVANEEAEAGFSLPASPEAEGVCVSWRKTGHRPLAQGAMNGNPPLSRDPRHPRTARDSRGRNGQRRGLVRGLRCRQWSCRGERLTTTPVAMDIIPAVVTGQLLLDQEDGERGG